MKQFLLIFFIVFPLFSFSQKILKECFAYPVDSFRAKEIIQNGGVDIDEKYYEGQTALILACSGGMVGVAKLLIDRGAKIYYRDNSGRTALMYALWEGKHIDLVEYLINHGASVNEKDANKVPAIFFAYYHAPYTIESKLEFIKLLEKNGANLHDVIGYNKQSLLSAAIEFGDFETVKYLIEQDEFDLNEKNNEGKDIIEEHANCKDQILTYLLSKMKPNKNYNNYFISAAQRNNFDFVVNLFNNYKIDVNTRDERGRTALINDNAQEELFSFLLKKEIDINAKDTSGMTALMCAIYIGNIPRVIMLIDKGAKVNLQDHYNWTALDYAENYRFGGTQYEERKEAMVTYLKKQCHAKNGKNKREKHYIYN